MFLRLKSILEYAFCTAMVNDTIHRLRAALNMSGFTKKALARQCGLHPNTLLGCEGEDWNPTLTTLRALEEALPSWPDIEGKRLPAWLSGDNIDHPSTNNAGGVPAQAGKSDDVTAHDIGAAA